MIRHIVLTKVKPDTPQTTIIEIFAGLRRLTQDLPGAQVFVGAPSNSPEPLERDYTHGFTIDFDTWNDLKTYADHPTHRALGNQLVAHAVGGIDGLLVVDLEL